MNERLQELAEQAKELAEQAFREDNAKRFTTMEKFAELIVRECMKLNRDILCEDDPDYLDQVYKEHFRVEE